MVSRWRKVTVAKIAKDSTGIKSCEALKGELLTTLHREKDRWNKEIETLIAKEEGGKKLTDDEMERLVLGNNADFVLFEVINTVRDLRCG